MVSGEHLQEVVPEEDSVVQVEEDLVDQEEEEDLTGLIEVISEEETEEEQDFQWSVIIVNKKVIKVLNVLKRISDTSEVIKEWIRNNSNVIIVKPLVVSLLNALNQNSKENEIIMTKDQTGIIIKDIERMKEKIEFTEGMIEIESL